jgi:hypothetical protein
MPQAVVVRAKIDAKAKTVAFQGDPGKTFQVMAGDTVKWDLQDLPPGSQVQVHFVPPFPGTPALPLFRGEHALKGSGGMVDGGAVAASALDGQYSYEVELLTTQGPPTKLKCLWSDGTSADMAGGKKSPAP